MALVPAVSATLINAVFNSGKSKSHGFLLLPKLSDKNSVQIKYIICVRLKRESCFIHVES
jgi:hypothetical protein